MPGLLASWVQDVAALAPGAAEPEVVAAGEDLLRRWGEAHRRYHDVRHLAEVCWALEELVEAHALTEDEAVAGRLAAWLHDAVYDPAAPPGRNEGASAELAAELLRRVGLPEATVDDVVALVLMTAEHEVRRDSAVQRAFHDADLWILAAPPERFDEYCGQVREEYASVPDAVFGPARSAVLRRLTASSAGPYRTDHARHEWSSRARDNVRRELDRLT